MGKQRTNISVDADLLADVRAMGVNVSRVCEDALRIARREAWVKENAEGLKAMDAWVEKNGLPLAKYQVLKID
jgi:antitoxin CcdA